MAPKLSLRPPPFVLGSRYLLAAPVAPASECTATKQAEASCPEPSASAGYGPAAQAVPAVGAEPAAAGDGKAAVALSAAAGPEAALSFSLSRLSTLSGSSEELERPARSSHCPPFPELVMQYVPNPLCMCPDVRSKEALELRASSPLDFQLYSIRGGLYLLSDDEHYRNGLGYAHQLKLGLRLRDTYAWAVQYHGEAAGASHVAACHVAAASPSCMHNGTAAKAPAGPPRPQPFLTAHLDSSASYLPLLPADLRTLAPGLGLAQAALAGLESQHPDPAHEPEAAANELRCLLQEVMVMAHKTLAAIADGLTKAACADASRQLSWPSLDQVLLYARP